MLKSNSREIVPGDSFIAIKGESYDGHDYIEDAIAAGATEIIAEHGLYSVDTFIVSDTKEYIKKYIDSLKEQLSGLHIIGVTGTNGKTTTCFLLYQALNSTIKKCAYIGTIGFYLDKKVRDLNNTTPSALEIYNMLLEAKEAGYEYVAMEVSSHALSQDRVYGLEFDVGIITNITQDHLDYHKTMEEYASAKQKLFYKIKTDGFAILWDDIEYRDYFELPENRNIIYGKTGDYEISNIKIHEDGMEFDVLHNKISKKYSTRLVGKYNCYNIMNVIIVLEQLGLSDSENVINTLLPPPGRMDIIQYGENRIIIDYAHTPDAVENILQCVKEFARGKIYVIVGCGGNRDKKKRPIMGHIATNLADYVIFTSDNPRDEDENVIIDDIVVSLTTTNYEIEINRKNAIMKGIQKCTKNDILLILGKGHENYQIIKGEKIHFDDKEIVLEYIGR